MSVLPFSGEALQHMSPQPQWVDLCTSLIAKQTFKVGMRLYTATNIDIDKGFGNAQSDLTMKSSSYSIDTEGESHQQRDCS